MTKKELSEIFSLWSLNWPNAELFQGGKEMLNARITLYANRLQDVGYWFGRKGALVSIDTRRFPPTIAEYRADIETGRKELLEMADFRFNLLRNEIPNGKESDLQAAYGRLLPCVREVVDSMGGMEQIFCADMPFLDQHKFQEAFAALEVQREAQGKIQAGAKARRLTE